VCGLLESVLLGDSTLDSAVIGLSDFPVSVTSVSDSAECLAADTAAFALSDLDSDLVLFESDLLLFASDFEIFVIGLEDFVSDFDSVGTVSGLLEDSPLLASTGCNDSLSSVD